MRLRKQSWSYLLCLAIFGLYLLVLAQIAFFPLQISGAYADAMRRERLFASFVNLIPFYFGPYGTLDSSLVTLIQNIVLTIPLGFGVNFVALVRPKPALWLALAVGFGLETTQLVISLLLGYPYRFIDVNDVIMNALGVLLGYVLFRVFACFYLGVTRHFGIPRRGLTAYVFEISRRV